MKLEKNLWRNGCRNAPDAASDEYESGNASDVSDGTAAHEPGYEPAHESGYERRNASDAGFERK